MSNPTTASDTQRRALLQAAAGLAAAGSLAMPSVASARVTKPSATGKPGDFDFLAGNWKIKNRQQKKGVWENFDSEAIPGIRTRPMQTSPPPCAACGIASPPTHAGGTRPYA